MEVVDSGFISISLHGKSIPGLPRSGKKVWIMKKIPGQGKSGNFTFSQGNLEEKK